MAFILEMDPAVAFSVRLHENTEINDSPCVFGTVGLNIGNGYDEFTGMKKSMPVGLRISFTRVFFLPN